MFIVRPDVLVHRYLPVPCGVAGSVTIPPAGLSGI
jgi:hypothetical protein